VRSDTDQRFGAEQIARRLLRTRAERYATVEAEERQILLTVVTFGRGEGRYALPLTQLREIRPLSRFCAIPFAPSIVPGIVHFRGELLSVHDLAAFTRPDQRCEQPGWLLVVEHSGARMGLSADDVMDVIEIEEGTIQPVPVTLEEAAELLTGMTADGVLVVDGARLFDVTRFAQAF
jgi:chemotaxis signal transduction protein